MGYVYGIPEKHVCAKNGSHYFYILEKKTEIINMDYFTYSSVLKMEIMIMSSSKMLGFL
jgi:hypothetical protein